VKAEAPPGTIADGIKDLRLGLSQWPVWWTLSWQGIRSQYRRTYLGPWWITAQQIIFVAGLSLLFGALMGQDLQTFIPYVTIGFITFTWMTTMITGGATSIVANNAGIKTSAGPLSIYALRNFAGATIQFAHNSAAIIVVVVFFQGYISWPIVLVPFGLLAICINGIATGLWLGPVVARYRDVGPIVNSLVSVLFFFTPVFWTSATLSKNQIAWLAGWNPLAYLLEFVRTPIIGQWPTLAVMVGVVVITVVNAAVGLFHFSRTRDRLAYWL
jgi:ABC-type polysaccharide/polyol phosphate export permease